MPNKDTETIRFDYFHWISSFLLGFLDCEQIVHGCLNRLNLNCSVVRVEDDDNSNLVWDDVAILSTHRHCGVDICDVKSNLL